jgi:hypothetical protein
MHFSPWTKRGYCHSPVFARRAVKNEAVAEQSLTNLTVVVSGRPFGDLVLDPRREIAMLSAKWGPASEQFTPNGEGIPATVPGN